MYATECIKFKGRLARVGSLPPCGFWIKLMSQSSQQAPLLTGALSGLKKEF